jgi:HAD superfamily phosphoserine phosphatase-like hydrolase
MGKKALVTDIDGTAKRRNLTELLLKGMIRHGLLQAEAWKDLQDLRHRYERRLIPWNQYDLALIEAYDQRQCLRGLRVTDVQRVAEEAIELEGDHLYLFTRALIRAAKNCEYKLVFISGSPRVIVEPFAKRHGCEVFYGTEFETDQGFFTGISPDWTQPKDVILDRLAREHDLDLEHSVSIGDTSRDIPMFEKTGYQILFNPNPELFQANRLRKWPWPIVMEQRLVYAYDMEVPRDRHFTKLVDILPSDLAAAVYNELKPLGVLA